MKDSSSSSSSAAPGHPVEDAEFYLSQVREWSDVEAEAIVEWLQKDYYALGSLSLIAETP